MGLFLYKPIRIILKNRCCAVWAPQKAHSSYFEGDKAIRLWACMLQKARTHLIPAIKLESGETLYYELLCSAVITPSPGHLEMFFSKANVPTPCAEILLIPFIKVSCLPPWPE